MQGDTPNDFDLYFQTESVAKKVVEYYVKKVKLNNSRIPRIIVDTDEPGRIKIGIKSSGIANEETNEDYRYFEIEGTNMSMETYINNMLRRKKNTKPYSLQLITTNAITLSDNIQIIIRFVGNVRDIHKNYDFVHTTNYYTSGTGLVLNPEALVCTMTRELKYVGSRYPVSSLFRIRKFIKRGWTISAGELLKISWDISKLDLTDRIVLQDQLAGVDAAYFNELMSILNKEIDKEIDRNYLYSLINQIFNDVSEEDINYSTQEVVRINEVTIDD